ncbi:uncharacterized protein LOC126901962 [Daktulosphaira vitifoliae]|uniref:uncharacterized protein LOC126901962 n=1 Tax=Daktulosphaira vitifoliae TaxID=58002 RepID=UPI0021AA55AF|nr:uncharacterized protein LOC126901962 [Daktulosphaira vitifoliae]
MDEVIIKNDSISRLGYSNDAQLKMTQHSTRKVSVKCGILKLVFEPTDIYAEIYVNYDDNVYYYSKSKKVNINFRKNDIVVTKKKVECNFSYDEDGINGLELYIRSLHKKIIFHVFKIYNSNLEGISLSVKSTVYNKKLRPLIENVLNSSLWNYVKDDLVELKNSNENVCIMTLENFINNSIMDKITVEEILHKIITVMNNRTTRYVLLLAIYAYEVLTIDYYFISNPFWDELMKYFTTLNEAKIKLAMDIIIKNSIEQLKMKNNYRIENFILKDLIKVCTIILYPSKQFYEHNFKEARNSKSENSNTHILEENVLNYVLEDFHNIPKFNVIPDTLDELKEKLKKIFELIDIEYTNILETDFVTLNNFII